MEEIRYAKEQSHRQRLENVSTPTTPTGLQLKQIKASLGLEIRYLQSSKDGGKASVALLAVCSCLVH